MAFSVGNHAPLRPGEIDGLHYFFKSKEEFEALIAAGGMSEWAVVHGQNTYGTLKSTVRCGDCRGPLVLLEIDLQGARQVKKAVPEAQLLGLRPAELEELVRCLGRGTNLCEKRQYDGWKPVKVVTSRSEPESR